MVTYVYSATNQFHDDHERLLSGSDTVEFDNVRMVKIAHESSFVHNLLDLILCEDFEFRLNSNVF